MTLDELDKLAANAFEGFIVRKDLVRKFKGHYPVPSYVGEFLLGKYCSSTDEDEINEGLAIVEKQLSTRTVPTNGEEQIRFLARKNGSTKVIDQVKAKLGKNDAYYAELPSLQMNDIRIPDWIVTKHQRLLTGGFYAEVDLEYDSAIAQEKNGKPFGITDLREIQLSVRDVLKKLSEGRREFTTEQWKQLLLRSIGLEPGEFSERNQDMILLRIVPFVERNYNVCELGPRGTGKSHLYQQVSPFAHLISGGKATVAQIFVNNSNGRRGLVCQYDAICFDEVSGISFDQKDGVNILKGYMESGEFSRGRESIRADGGVVLVGNFDVDVEHQQRVSHLFGPLPPEMRDDTAFMDRIHSYIPGWDIPKVSPSQLTDHFGLVSDFISSCWNQLRSQSRVAKFQNRIQFGGALSGRDINGVQKTMSGLLKLMYPDGDSEIPDEDIEWAAKIALECRRRVKEQQKRIGAAEFRNTQFSFTMGEDGVETFVATPEIQSSDQIDVDPPPPGQVWAISPGGMDENAGLFKVEVNEGPGSGVKILNKPVPQPFKECVQYAEQNLYSKAQQLVGDKDPRGHEFNIQLRAFDSTKSGSLLGVATLVAMCGALLHKSVQGGLIIAGNLNLGGSLDDIYNGVSIAELAVEKGAKTLLMPVSSRRQLMDLSDEMATEIDLQFYKDPRDALLKALE